MSLGRRFQSLTVVGRKAEVLYCVLAETLEPQMRELGAGERGGGASFDFHVYSVPLCLSVLACQPVWRL